MMDAEDLRLGRKPARTRRLPVGAEPTDAGTTHFRLWAPRCKAVEVVFEGAPHVPSLRLAAEPRGYFAGVGPVCAGARYRFRLDGDAALHPDPASRFQPEGPHGPSEVIDPSRFAWTDRGWRGCSLEGQCLYEMHMGTFTPEGTWDAARADLPALADLGISVIEMMPVADFAGEFGWGYDGVNLYAPTRLYGRPDDLRRFVDAAHALGIGVILDVVYNHFGPDGNHLPAFSDDYLSKRHRTDWGDGINYDGDDCGPVRELVIANAGYWIAEYHFDGLRLDATQDIRDDSEEHVLACIGRRAREAAPGRDVLLVAENESQQARLVRPLARGGFGLDAVWNDDFHHAARVALTGRREAYYSDYAGTPQELLSALKWGYLFQGQRYAWQDQRRGQPALDVDPSRFVVYLENHDQVANTARGERLHRTTSPGRWRALVATVLLSRSTPLLFQGEEFRSSTPFLFFADHDAALNEDVHRGRQEFLSQFPSFAGPEVLGAVAPPGDRRTFEACKLDRRERDANAGTVCMYRDLLALRRTDPVFSNAHGRVEGATLGPSAFVRRSFGGAAGDRLLLVNLGADLHPDSVPEPLLAPPNGMAWDIAWSSEDPRYGGSGTPAVDRDGRYFVPGESAVVLRPGRGGGA